METLTTVIAAVLIVTGIAGLIVPVLPGLILTVIGVFVWSCGHSSIFAWSVFAAACAFAVVGWLVQYMLPSRRLSEAGIPRRSQLIGLAFAFLGFFLIPVIGLFIGFALGVFAAETERLRDTGKAVASTKVACRAALLSVWIELFSAGCIAFMWAVCAFAASRSSLY